MDADRPEKKTIRKLWVATIKESIESDWGGPEPLYLTLSGAGGRDIESLTRRGILKRNEVGNIAEEDLEKVVAVESSPDAVLILQKKFPGLKIWQHPVHNLVRSTNPIRWPEGKEERYCRARVINLDLNQPLSSMQASGQICFPVLQWIEKLAQIHAISPPLPTWDLFLTLHGQIGWDENTSRMVRDFLRENFQVSTEFASACRALLGDELYNKIDSQDEIDFRASHPEEQQKLLMCFVPKKIAQLVVIQGWLVTTARNIRYGGGAHAPMVTWLITFTWDLRVSSTPNAVYSECLRSILAKSGYIEENGSLS
jgi:hypothetical protein